MGRRGAYKILMQKPERNRSFGRPRRRKGISLEWSTRTWSGLIWLRIVKPGGGGGGAVVDTVMKKFPFSKTNVCTVNPHNDSPLFTSTCFGGTQSSAGSLYSSK
jgi:hypothetical protein